MANKAIESLTTQEQETFRQEIGADNATNLTIGTLPDARFPATLPVASGVNLTALNATNLTSGTVAPARLASSGTASATTYLAGDGTWKNYGSSSGAPSNADVNTAIATDPKSTRTSLNLTGVPTANSGNRLYNTLNRLTTDRQAQKTLVLRTLTLGDSWAQDATIGMQGAIGSFGQIAGANFAILNGTAALSTVYGDFPLSPWAGQYITLSANISSHATFGKSSQAAIKLDSIRYATVFYEGQVAGNSFTVQYEDATGAFQPIGTVATNVVATSGLQVFESLAFPSSLSTRIRVVWASGSPRVMAAGGTNSLGNEPAVTATRTGLVRINADSSGSTMAQMASTSQASWNTVLGWLKPDIVYFREKPEVPLNEWTPNFDQLITRIRTAWPTCDLVFIGRHLTGDNTENQNKLMDDYTRAYAQNADNAASFVDIISYMPETFDKSRVLGINRTGIDTQHTTNTGNMLIGDIVFDHIWQPLSRFLSAGNLAAPLQYGVKTMGTGFNLTGAPLTLFLDGTYTNGSATIQFTDVAGGNTINHKSRLGLLVVGAGWTGSNAAYNEGFSLIDGSQPFMRWDSAKRCIMSNTQITNYTRIPAGRLEVNAGSVSQVGLAVTVLPGQTANALDIYSSTTTSSFGTLVTSFGPAGALITVPLQHVFPIGATISLATPCVISINAHGLLPNQPVVFTSSDTLPSGITSGTTYYVSPTNFGVSSFSISASINGSTQIATTTAGSGAHTVTPAFYTDSPNTSLVTTAPSQAITLPNGTVGQIKTITHVARTGGGTAVLTPTLVTGLATFASITFTAVGDTVTLQYYASIGWVVLSSRGASVA